MGVRNCIRCGKIFNVIGNENICPACRKAEEDLFQTTKEYIRANPASSLKEVSEACKVRIPQLQQWIREERLELVVGSAISLTCEKCGKKIYTGRFCNECKEKTAANFSSTASLMRQKSERASDNKPSQSGMRFMKG